MAARPGQAQHRLNDDKRPQARPVARIAAAATYSKVIGRVGALAVALGVGVGFTIGMPGLAWADDTESSSSPDPSPNPTSKQPDTKPSTDPEPEREKSSDDADDERHEPTAVTAEPTDDTASEPATVEPPVVAEPTPTPSFPPVETDQPIAPAPVPAEIEPPAETPVDPPTPAPQSVSPPDSKSATPPPSDPLGGLEPVDNMNETPDGNTSGTAVTATLNDPIDTSPLTSSDVETTAFSATTLRVDSHIEGSSASAQNISLDAAPNPAQALLAIPGAAVDIATTFVAAVLSPMLAPSPAAPAQPPLLFFAVLDWVRREIQRTFFNRSPHAVANSYTTSEGLDVSGNVLTNDTDPDGDALRASLVDGPDHGALVLNADGTFVYNPSENYSGTDTFTYKVQDVGIHLHGLLGFLSPDQGHSDTATVTITITPDTTGPVVANDDTVVGDEDRYVTFDVLANDTGGDGDPLELSISSGPVNGYVVINGGDNSLSYLPNSNFFGTDTFTYTVSDGDTTDTATVTITVNSINDEPVSTADSYTVTAGETLTVAAPGVLANDTDLDGDPLTAVKYSDPTHGTVTLNSDGSFTYIADADFAGLDQFEYYAYDGISYINISYVNITVSQELAPVAGYDSVATAAGTPVTIDSDDLLHNDFDNENDPLTVVVNKAPESGELVANGDGTYTYTPEDGFIGIDSFEYVAADATGESDPAVVSINVGIPANTAPEAVSDYLTTRADAPRVITPVELVGNDTDADGGVLTPYVVSDPIHGTLTLNVGGTYTYTPDPGFQGFDTFYYTAFDGYADSTPTLVTIGVAGQPTGNTPPVAGYDSLGTDVDTPLTINPDTLLVNDFDADSDPLSVVVTEHPLNGTLSTDSTGNLVYTPDDGFTGTDSFFYSAAQPENASLPAEVTINVGGPANTAPEATPDELFTGVDTPLAITADDLLGNDTDADGDDLTGYAVSDPADGTLVDNLDGTFTYTPEAGFVGTVSFFYTAFDGQADSIPTLVTIDVGGLGPNTPPVAYDDFLFTPVDTPLTIAPEDIFGNDIDPDGDSSQLTGSLVTLPANGIFSTDGSGVYTPNPGFEGIDSFTYQADDGRDVSNVATVTITVGQLPD